MANQFCAPFEETDNYIEFEIPWSHVGFIESANGRLRVYKNYLAIQQRWACIRLLSNKQALQSVSDPQELIDQAEMEICKRFQKLMQAFLVLKTDGIEKKEYEGFTAQTADYIRVVLQAALIRETARISNLVGEMFDENSDPTDEDWDKTIDKIQKGKPSGETEEED